MVSSERLRTAFSERLRTAFSEDCARRFRSAGGARGRISSLNSNLEFGMEEGIGVDSGGGRAVPPKAATAHVRRATINKDPELL